MNTQFANRWDSKTLSAATPEERCIEMAENMNLLELMNYFDDFDAVLEALDDETRAKFMKAYRAKVADILHEDFLNEI